MTEGDDGALLTSVAEGGGEAARAALAELYRRHAPAVLGFLARALGDRNDAEDLLHDTFLATRRRAGGFRGADARGWIMTIAANRLRDHLRGRDRRKRRERAVSRAEEEARPTDVGVVLESVLARMSTRDRTVIELRFVEERAHAEVAQLLGVSLRTAKEWSHRALARLREAVGDER